MSRAFVRESDDPQDELPVVVKHELPPGVPNHMTPAGARKLQHRLSDLLERKQHLSEAREQSTETETELRKIQSDIRQLQRTLESIAVTPAPMSHRDRISFGAMVVVRRSGNEETYRIVGLDETDLDQGYISWRSPLARALLSKRKGDVVHFDSPSGKENIEILSVSYAE